MSRVAITGVGLGFQRVVTVVALAALVVPMAGCASSKAKNRMRTLSAQNADLRQQTSDLQGQVVEQTSAADRLDAELKHAQLEADNYRDTLAGSQAQTDEALRRAAIAENERDQALGSADEALRTAADTIAQAEAQQAEIARLREENYRLAQMRQPRNDTRDPSLDYERSPALRAFKRDLQDQLAAEGINMPVEIRTARDGARRVAVVLPDAFKAGKATLAYNPDAVTAVVRLGQLVQEHYGDSVISVEGHTDSDPIRKSNWRDNMHLSEARAEHVATLLENTGLSRSSVSVVGRGAEQPIEEGASSRAKSRNRRVELYIPPR